jgi:hypothetical protein
MATIKAPLHLPTPNIMHGPSSVPFHTRMR